MVRAVLGAPTVDPTGFHATVRRAADRRTADARGDQDPPTNRVLVSLDVDVADTDVGIHRTFDPYFAVLRVTFPDLDVAVRPSALALRFSYDQH